MSRKRSDPDFSKSDYILNFQPDLSYHEPDPQEDDRLDQIEEAPREIQDARNRTRELIKNYDAITKLANLTQKRIDGRVIAGGGLAIKLHLQKDHTVVSAIKRQYAKEDGSKITYDMYQNSLKQIEQNKSATPKITEEQILEAKADPLRTDFGGLKSQPGENRPEIAGPDFIKPIDINQFKQATLSALGSTTGTGEAVDIDRLSIGSEFQDHSLITSTYERAAHSTPSETAVFATISKPVQNTKVFAEAARDSLITYLQSPEDKSQLEPTQSIQALQAFPLEGEVASLPDQDFGERLLRLLKECIPCSLRINAYLELHPNLEFIAALETDVLARLEFLARVGRMLTNFDIYADLCALVNLLSFMCIPDLQRIIALLMSLLTIQVPSLNDIAGMIQGLIAPIFAPVLAGLTSLLDQFNIMVVSPMDCILTAINEQSRKLGLVIEPGREINRGLDRLAAEKAELEFGINSGLIELNDRIIEAKNEINAKLDLYISQTKALLGEFSLGGKSYLDFSFKKLQIVRLVAFIVAVIDALVKGQIACNEQSKSLEQTEIDNFFNNFLNPTQAFEIYLDPDGNINIQEKVDGFKDIANPPEEEDPLKNFGPVVQFEGEAPVSSPQIDSVRQRIKETTELLARTQRVTVRCNLNTPTEDASKVQNWIAELDQIEI